ncbi:hypothetical protein KA005_31895 [bacterium]|nr:hypothetical protein [bacterium]
MGGVNKTQEFLEGLSPKPLPPELREKILSTAYQRQSKFLVISPVLRMLFAISCVLAVVAFFCDIMIKNSENDFLTSIMNGSQVSEMMQDKNLQEMKDELFKIDYDQRINQWVIRHYKTKKTAAKITGLQKIMDILKE